MMMGHCVNNLFSIIFSKPALILTGLIVVAPAYAELDALTSKLESRIKASTANEEARQQAIKQGREQAFFCANCHGKDGNSTKDEVPNLAGQKPVYLLQQINAFATGKRKDYTTVMQQLASKLTEEEQLSLAVYFASVTPRFTYRDLDPGLMAQGLELYKSKCTSCHGATGAGTKDFARIAGQNMGYLKLTLANFRDGTLNRQSQIMSPIAKDLSDNDIESLVAYISQLKP
jgi:cytochrome c553